MVICRHKPEIIFSVLMSRKFFCRSVHFGNSFTWHFCLSVGHPETNKAHYSKHRGASLEDHDSTSGSSGFYFRKPFLICQTSVYWTSQITADCAKLGSYYLKCYCTCHKVSTKSPQLHMHTSMSASVSFLRSYVENLNTVH